MNQRIARIALVVRDYDEAIAFYTQKLKFTLVEDTVLSPTKRWVVVAPPGNDSCCLLLARAANEVQEQAIGHQTGGRVFLFLYTDDIERDLKEPTGTTSGDYPPTFSRALWKRVGFCRFVWEFVGFDPAGVVSSETRYDFVYAKFIWQQL